MIEIELEKTYLVKRIPEDVENFPHKEIIDVYFPVSERHPVLRLRKSGDKYEMTKKSPVHGKDSSEQYEHTIKLTEEEFKSLSEAKGKKSRKLRYYYKKNGIDAEIAVYKDDLEGLVLVDFEFKDSESKDNFKEPDYCLADVTQDEIFAGGMLCGKKFSDLEPVLKKFGYSINNIEK